MAIGLGANLKSVAAAVVAAASLAFAPIAKAGVLARIFGDHARQADCIRAAESRGNRYAVSPTGDYGWFQINYRTWAGHVVSFYTRRRGVWIRLPRDLGGFKRVTFNPVRNAQLAWAISKGGTDWQPWSTYSRRGLCR